MSRPASEALFKAEQEERPDFVSDFCDWLKPLVLERVLLNRLVSRRRSSIR